ncbi:hypothetical protein, partial [Salmonella sp. M205]|uniref:hypothetical protein n=1 Tax=Salmonella sp. M205 TaxID=3240294 RepID=UPI00352B8833
VNSYYYLLARCFVDNWAKLFRGPILCEFGRGVLPHGRQVGPCIGICTAFYKVCSLVQGLEHFYHSLLFFIFIYF